MDLKARRKHSCYQFFAIFCFKQFTNLNSNPYINFLGWCIHTKSEKMSLQIQRMASPKLLHLCCYHGGNAWFSCLKRPNFLFNSGVPHIGTGVALLFSSSQSRLSEGTSCYLILWIRCFNAQNRKDYSNFFINFVLSDQGQISD